MQRQIIGAELGRRQAESRKEAVAEWQAAADDAATDAASFKVVPADR